MGNGWVGPYVQLRFRNWDFWVFEALEIKMGPEHPNEPGGGPQNSARSIARPSF